MKKYNYEEMVGTWLGNRKLISINRENGRIYLTYECKCGKVSTGLSYMIMKNKDGGCKSCGQFNHKFEGTKINKWFVIERDKKHPLKFICQCECGWKTSIKSDDLNRNNTKSCMRCCAKGRKNKKYAFKGYGVISGTLISQKRNRAKKKNMDCNISCEYLQQLYLEQNKKCAYTNLDLNLWKDDGLVTGSLDRKDSSLGYIQGNVQWVHRNVNKMKQDLTEEQFVEYCRLITYNQNKNLQHQIIPMCGL